MTNKPESAAVEAVAWQLRVLHKPFLRADMRWSKWQACSEEEFDAVQRGDPYCEYETVESRALYPQSALDALRGEVERWKSLHDSASISLEVQSGALSSALSRATAAERRVAECLEFIDGIREELHNRRVADWFPEGAHNAAEQMSEDMRLIGNACADFDPATLTKESP